MLRPQERYWTLLGGLQTLQWKLLEQSNFLLRIRVIGRLKSWVLESIFDHSWKLETKARIRPGHHRDFSREQMNGQVQAWGDLSIHPTSPMNEWALVVQGNFPCPKSQDKKKESGSRKMQTPPKFGKPIHVQTNNIPPQSIIFAGLEYG